MSEQEKDKLNQELARAREIEAILENPHIKGAQESIKNQLIIAWISTGPGDSELREQIWHLIKAQANFAGILNRHMATGGMAKIRLEEIATQEKPESESD